MKIDVFNHILPRKFMEKAKQVQPNGRDIHKRVRNIPALYDLEMRFRIMDQFEEYVQVLTLSSPPIEAYAPPPVSCELARLANDEMAELVARYSDRFFGFVASLPLNDPEGSLQEAERAIKELGACGVQVFTNVNGRPLLGAGLLPLFEFMARVNRPIWIHPARGADFPDYKGEKKSHYEIWWAFGWPYETSVAMAHLVFAGVFDHYPNLKIITHHCGGIVPYLEGRIGPGWDQLGSRTSDEDYTQLLKNLKKRPIEYFRMFYADTAMFGSKNATWCGVNFFGVDRVLFASDMPFDPEGGTAYIKWTIEVIESLPLNEEERKKIYEKNFLLIMGQNSKNNPMNYQKGINYQ